MFQAEQERITANLKKKEEEIREIVAKERRDSDRYDRRDKDRRYM